MFYDRTNQQPSLTQSSSWNSTDDFRLCDNTKKYTDRFIPTHVNRNLFMINDTNGLENNSKMNKMMEEDYTDGNNDNDNKFKMLLKKNVMEEDNMHYNPLKKTTKKSLEKESMGKSQRKILSFQKSIKDENEIEIHSPDHIKNYKPTNYSRKINTQPVKILDAPSLQDDFYFNLVDWSESNFITIGLINHVYSLDANSNRSFK